MASDVRSPWHHHRRKGLTEQDAAKLFMEHNGCCDQCGRKLYPQDEWIIEHLIALELGGTNDRSNLGITCSWCKPGKDASDHKAAGHNRRTATRHVLPASMKTKSALAKKPGYKFNWREKRYERIEE